VKASADGRVDLAHFARSSAPTLPALMLTNPNTCGLFERDMIEIAAMVHAPRVFLLRRRELQRDRRTRCGRAISASTRCHINLHKTFLHAAWRRRTGRGPRRLLRAARAARALCR
jgi:glycine dehydrogenase subunit 2